MKTNTLLSKGIILSLLLLLMLFSAACSRSGDESTTNAQGAAAETDHDDGQAMDDHDAEHEDAHDESEPHLRIPNENGAGIHIISPADGDVFAHGDQIIVEVETENFDLSQEGYHWHVYVDGKSWGMVMGGNTDQPLTGVEPGEHEIAVYLSIPTHEEYEEGDTIQVTVEE